jgi:hypothetical protein
MRAFGLAMGANGRPWVPIAGHARAWGRPCAHMAWAWAPMAGHAPACGRPCAHVAGHARACGRPWARMWPAMGAHFAGHGRALAEDGRPVRAFGADAAVRGRKVPNRSEMYRTNVACEYYLNTMTREWKSHVLKIWQSNTFKQQVGICAIVLLELGRTKNEQFPDYSSLRISQRSNFFSYFIYQLNKCRNELIWFFKNYLLFFLIIAYFSLIFKYLFPNYSSLCISKCSNFFSYIIYQLSKCRNELIWFFKNYLLFFLIIAYFSLIINYLNIYFPITQVFVSPNVLIFFPTSYIN